MTNSNERADPKEKADVPPVLPSEQPGGSGGSGVLTPEDLDFTDSPYVAEVSDGRYVVSADGAPNVAESTEMTTRSNAEPATESRSETPSRSTESRSMESTGHGGSEAVRSPEIARSVLADELERADVRYGLDIVSRFDSRTVRHRTTSDDVVGTFNNLVLWYAQHAATEMPTGRTASLLLEKSEFSTPLSPGQIRRAARKHGLNRSSTIGELLDAIE